MIISLFSPGKKELTPGEFFQGVIKKMVGMIRDSENAYLACKKCGIIAKEVDEVEAASIPRNSRRPTLWNFKLHKAITAMGIMCIRYFNKGRAKRCQRADGAFGRIN
nr:replication protein A 70 kDa DNA-binding subunit B [Tanacetum cinerariifolium]